MKTVITLLLVSIISMPVFTQGIYVQSGADWYAQPNTLVTIYNGGVNCEGNFYMDDAELLLTGDIVARLEGTAPFTLGKLTMNKETSQLLLDQYVYIKNTVNFIQGKIDLNNQVLQLMPDASIQNESESHHFTGTNGGYVQIYLPMNAPSYVNPGNIGIHITSQQDFGYIGIKRGHQPVSGNGLSTTIQRWFELESTLPVSYVSVNFQYLNHETQPLDELTLSLFHLPPGHTDWQEVNLNGRNTNTNSLEVYGLAQLGRLTAGLPAGALPVTGLDFYAKRISKGRVQLDWKTLQEMNNKGFSIERREESQPNFTPIGYVFSKAPGGNSPVELIYQWIDQWAPKSATIYRLKQEDLNGAHSYSDERGVKAVAGGKKNTLTAWPVPSTGPVNLLLEGSTDRESQTGFNTEYVQIGIFDLNGRLIKADKLQWGKAKTLQGLLRGTYVIKVLDEEVEPVKIIVQ